MSLAKHQKDYKVGAWEKLTLQEMGNAVHFYAKRAESRTYKRKAEKDLYNAQNYLELMKKKLDLIIGDIAVNIEMTGVP